MKQKIIITPLDECVNMEEILKSVMSSIEDMLNFGLIKIDMYEPRECCKTEYCGDYRAEGDAYPNPHAVDVEYIESLSGIRYRNQ